MRTKEDNRDENIREALKAADQNGKLDIVADVIGIAGGEDELRQIMNSTGELNALDRGMIGLHLGL